ncbi:unnamed protein product [Psylliodes chrysocephalus]|uniref:Kinetochore protein SPC25 n=1 Tax=Psylliodes chrysocephalus TaxID=3402493 RepID=A0A9P0G6L9_9CUCU|nr:unnamed protein product [Psylliodes chrysocephala]
MTFMTCNVLKVCNYNKKINSLFSGSNFEEDLEKFTRKYRDAKKENYDILKKCEEARRTREELIESCKKLESTGGELSDIKNSLESEISKITSDHKLHKAAYKTALQHYNNFDFNVAIVESSDDDIFVANVTFKFAKHIEPIKIVVNRNQRKIIEIDSHGLMDTQNFEDVNFDPLFFCNLRQKVLDSVNS